MRTGPAVVVNSCLSYHRATLPPLLRSLRHAGVPPDDVFVVVGDAPGPGHTATDGVRLWFVPWSNIDDTALIWCVTPEGREALRDREWVFYMHDTTAVMPKFGHEVSARLPASPVVPAAVPLKQFPSMSMGYYRLRDLWTAGDVVLALRNDDTSEHGRAKAKNAPGLEDGLFKLLLGRGHVSYPDDVLNPGDCVKNADESPYGGVVRVRETWDVPGLYKYKANWGQSHELHVAM